MISVGSILMAIGPMSVLFLFFVLPRPHLVVVSTIASFWWVCAMILASVIWWAIPPARQIYGWVLFETVACQELFRWLFYVLTRRLMVYGDDLKCFVRNGKRAGVVEGISVGASWGLMSVLVNYVGFLKDSYMDDSSIYIPECPLNFWVAGAAFAMAFSLLHVALSVAAWQLYSMRWSLYKGFTVLSIFLVHLGFSLLGLGNLNVGGCVWTLGVTWGGLAVFSIFVGYLTWRNLIRPNEE